MVGVYLELDVLFLFNISIRGPKQSSGEFSIFQELDLSIPSVGPLARLVVEVSVLVPDELPLWYREGPMRQQTLDRVGFEKESRTGSNFDVDCTWQVVALTCIIQILCLILI